MRIYISRSITNVEVKSPMSRAHPGQNGVISGKLAKLGEMEMECKIGDIQGNFS